MSAHFVVRVWRFAWVRATAAGFRAIGTAGGRWVPLRGRLWWRAWRHPRPLPASKVRTWIRMRAARRLGRLESRLGAGAVARAMVLLNREARRSITHRYAIYQLKNRLVRELHRRYGASVGVDHQVLECWGCGGPSAPASDCWKCGGTGIYGRHRLYRFTFRVRGRRYTWHQPELLVDWPVEVEGDAGLYRGDGRASFEIRPLSTLGVVRRMAMVEAWLERRGAGFMVEQTPRPNPRRLRDAIRWDRQAAAERRRARWADPDDVLDLDLPF